MKFKFLLTLFVAGVSVSASAQGYKDGIEYFKADRLENAEELLLRNLGNANTDKAASNFYLGQISLVRYDAAVKKGDSSASKYKSAALKYFNDGIAANPEYAFNYVGLGHIELLNNNTKGAEENFKKAEKLDKKDAGIYAAIARAYYNVNPTLFHKEIEKRMEQGDSLLYKRVTSSNPVYEENDQDFYILRGDMTANQAKGNSLIIGQACNDYEQAIAVNPKAGEAYVKYADALFEINPDAAIAQLKKLLSENSQSALGQRELAEKLYEKKQLSAAMAEYEKLMANPNHFKRDEDRYLAILYFNNNFDKGFEAASRFVTNNPDQFTARRFKFIFANKLKKAEAVKLADELVALKSDKNRFASGDYAMIAELYAANGRMDDAVAIIKQGIADYPKDYDMYNTLANLVYKTDSYTATDAMEKYIAGLAADNKTVSGTNYFMLAQFATIAATEAKGETDEAKAATYFDKALAAAQKAEELMINENKYLPARMIGQIEYTRGNKELGMAAFARAFDYIEKSGVKESNQAVYDDLKKILNK